MRELQGKCSHGIENLRRLYLERYSRHSTAIHLLKSGVDLVTSSHWLGHASINTTNRYTTIDLEMKRDAINKADPIGDGTPPTAAWRTDTSIFAWLEWR